MKIYCVFTDETDILFTDSQEDAVRAQKAHEGSILNCIEAGELDPGESLEDAYLRAAKSLLEGIKNDSKAFLGFI
ncbi:MAG: hypothetical protein IJ242_12890 [Clostridia bacterium]|nr:hypothetical protein [Clostridia bacterium]